MLAGATASDGSASNSIRMEIKDNGKGFEVDRVRSAKRHKRLGQLGMHKRVELVGDSFAVVFAPGQGTTIHAQMPFRNGA
jgi:signal transduction histidine kinase